jgi:hypothetical protein
MTCTEPEATASSRKRTGLDADAGACLSSVTVVCGWADDTLASKANGHTLPRARADTDELGA